MKKYTILFLLAILISLSGYSQTHTNQNGIQTSVIGTFGANGMQAQRYEIATVGYNSHHWQSGGTIIAELFHETYGTGYEKYFIEIEGAGHTGVQPRIKLVESEGLYHNAKITLGNPQDLSTEHGGAPNRAIPIYLDVREYSHYKVKLTYMRPRVATVTSLNEIKINESPSPVNINDFTSPVIIDRDINYSGSLRVRGNGNHFIENVNVGIGTVNPDQKLTVKGKIHAEEVIIDLNVPLADYVFKPEYKLMPLAELEQFVKTNNHLPEIPSASDVEQAGMSLGEMQNKLLQKIEELTLYSIQQEKRIKELEDQLRNK